MPFLVNELFKDEEWEKFDSTAMEDVVPAEAMKANIQYAILHEGEEMDRMYACLLKVRFAM